MEKIDGARKKLAGHCDKDFNAYFEAQEPLSEYTDKMWGNYWDRVNELKKKCD
jgi:hypothetical protein